MNVAHELGKDHLQVHSAIVGLRQHGECGDFENPLGNGEAFAYRSRVLSRLQEVVLPVHALAGHSDIQRQVVSGEVHVAVGVRALIREKAGVDLGVHKRERFRHVSIKDTGFDVGPKWEVPNKERFEITYARVGKCHA